jgi:hypothetical protein
LALCPDARLENAAIGIMVLSIHDMRHFGLLDVNSMRGPAACALLDNAKPFG